jgi:hypothetical protein
MSPLPLALNLRCLYSMTIQLFLVNGASYLSKFVKKEEKKYLK